MFVERLKFGVYLLGLALLFQSSAAAQVPGFQADKIYRSCSSNAFAVSSQCVQVDRLNASCTALGGEARWSKAAFYCRAPERASNGSSETSAGSSSGFNSFGGDRRRRAFADFEQNDSENAEDENFTHRVCSQNLPNVGGTQLSGEICRFSSKNSDSPVIGFFQFSFSEPTKSFADINCVWSRLSAILDATITHYNGKRVNASRNYNFCNVTGRFSLVGNF